MLPLGDNPQGEQLMAWFRERWRQTLESARHHRQGRRHRRRQRLRHSPTATGIITAANIAYTAAGEDLFAVHPVFRQRLLYDAFAAYPDTIGGPDAGAGYPGRPCVEAGHRSAATAAARILAQPRHCAATA